ncbi:PPE family protein, partial [Mycobacterium sp. 663a-19]|nr:PPE family protein [Mycobacterium sp. 663a-19]
MYAGPGSGPMMAAAAAWDGLAAELAAAAAGYGSVVSELTGAPWVGPASASMLSAVTPYVSWLDTMAGQAEETANQARAAAAAYETAFMMTVPPPVIAANRVLLATLIATNFFGQNTPAIAATEAQYLEMWAQDATTMYGYSASSATASTLTPFRSPPNTTTPQAPADQALAVAQAQATPAGNSGQTVASMTPQLASTPATQAPGTVGLPNPNTPWWQLSPANYDTVLKRMTGLPYQSNGLAAFGVAIGQQLFNGPVGTTAGAQGAFFVTPQFAALGAGGWTWHPAALPAATASLSSATKIGGLSVPQSWAAATGVE